MALASSLVAPVGQRGASVQSNQWSDLQASVLVLLEGKSPVGIAALIDPRGYFIATRSVFDSDAMTGRSLQGQTYTLRLITVDDPSQIALLQAEGWLPGTGRPVRVSSLATPSSNLTGLTATGPIRVELTHETRAGLLSASKSRRVMPLSEMRFETPEQAIGGALVFNQAGELVGMIDAALRGQPVAAPAAAGSKSLGLAQQYGPSSLTVAYAISSDVLARVVDGFRSPAQRAVYPAIGVFCRDAEGGGALVDSVNPKSPAELTGIRAGDVILEIDNIPIRTQVDFSLTMMRQTVGAAIPVKVRRGQQILTMLVRVGS